MSDLKKLKFIQRGYETYTGPIGKFDFVDGVSTELIHRVDRDQLSAAFQFVEVDGEGNEQEAGVAARLVSESADMKAEVTSLARMTDAEKDAEGRRAVLMAKKPDIELFTRTQLEALAGKHGIKGLRSQVGDKWGVKNRSIPLLIDEILVAQNNWIASRNEQINTATKVEAPVEPTPAADADEGLTDEQLAAAAEGNLLDEDLKGADALAGEIAKDKLTAADLAAATGDLGAALNQENQTDAPSDDPVADEPAGEGAAEAPAADATAGAADAGGAA